MPCHLLLSLSLKAGTHFTCSTHMFVTIVFIIGKKHDDDNHDDDGDDK